MDEIEIKSKAKGITYAGFKVARFIIVLKLLDVISYTFAGFMIYLVSSHGFWTMMAVSQPLYFFICLGIIAMHDYFLSNGYDLLLMDYNAGLRGKTLERRQIFKRLAQWIMKRETTIFWLGNLWLEPDITTLLLRRGSSITLRDTLAITLPSNLIFISFWGVVYYLGLKGYKYFEWS